MGLFVGRWSGQGQTGTASKDVDLVGFVYRLISVFNLGGFKDKRDAQVNDLSVSCEIGPPEGSHDPLV